MAEKLFRFEASWESGNPPQLEDFLDADSSDRIELLTQLVLILSLIHI